MFVGDSHGNTWRNRRPSFWLNIVARYVVVVNKIVITVFHFAVDQVLCILIRILVEILRIISTLILNLTLTHDFIVVGELIVLVGRYNCTLACWVGVCVVF